MPRHESRYVLTVISAKLAGAVAALESRGAVADVPETYRSIMEARRLADERLFEMDQEDRREAEHYEEQRLREIEEENAYLDHRRRDYEDVPF